jgi:hypothetical protein
MSPFWLSNQTACFSKKARWAGLSLRQVSEADEAEWQAKQDAQDEEA